MVHAIIVIFWSVSLCRVGGEIIAQAVKSDCLYKILYIWADRRRLESGWKADITLVCRWVWRLERVGRLNCLYRSMGGIWEYVYILSLLKFLKRWNNRPNRQNPRYTKARVCFYPPPNRPIRHHITVHKGYIRPHYTFWLSYTTYFLNLVL